MLRWTILFGSLVAVFAAVARAPLEQKPEKFANVPGCYIQELDTVIPFGKAAPSKTSCLEYRCDEAEVLLLSCGAVNAGPDDKLVTDKGKPYPDCCSRIAL